MAEENENGQSVDPLEGLSPLERLGAVLQGGITINLPPGEVDETPLRFSNDPDVGVREQYEATVEILSGWLGLEEGLTGRYIDSEADTFRQINGQWPTPEEMLGDPELWAGAAKLPTGASLLPPMFFTFDEEGNRQLWDNSTFTGPAPVELPEIAGLLSERMGLSLAAAGVGPVMPGRDFPDVDVTAVPTLPQHLLQQVLTNTRNLFGGGGGGGGGGRNIVFDRNHLVEQITNLWRSLMLEEPRNAGSLADKYIREATSFYQQGGQLNLETWILGAMRDTDRYSTLYGRKPEHQSEGEYLAGFQNQIAGYGLMGHVEQQELVRGLSSGTSELGFANQLRTLPEVRVANRGGFSQQFAQRLAGIGGLLES